MSDFHIRPLRLDEMAVPLGWAEREGWNPGLQDAAPFFVVDPAGFLGGYLNNVLIATISAVRYDESFGFMGFYIVDPRYRGHQYGWQVWCAGLAHLDAVACVGLDGVLAQQSNYVKSGFMLAHKNSRYEGKPQQSGGSISLAASETLHSIADVPLDALMTFDSQHFPTSRPTFLPAWINQAGHQGQVIVRDGRVSGYGVIRPCVSGYKIGPLFAQTTRQARNLVLALCDSIESDALVYIDPPAQNKQAIQLLESFGMTMVFETARMYKGGFPKLALPGIFGITSFELG
jgi:hypothetical protein